MGQFGKPPKRAQLLRIARDPLVHQLPAQTPGNQVEIGAGISGPCGERAREPFAKVVHALNDR